MTITATDFAISSGGAITDTGGSTIYPVLDLHVWLQDLADNPSATADDNVSILGANPSELAGKRSTARPMVLTLLNGVNIDDTVSHRFKFGSIEQLAGATLYTGINTIGSGLTGRSHYAVQDGAKYNSGTKWWSAGPIQALFKVKASSALIGSGTAIQSAQAGYVTIFSREWGYTYSHFDVDCSAGSEQVAALSVAADPNCPRSFGNYSFGTNTVTSTSPSFTVTVTPGSSSHDLLDGSGSKGYKGTISWTGGARLAEVWQALQAACNESATGTINGLEGWRYRKLDAAYAENIAAPFGTLITGGKWYVARGWWIDTGSLNSLDLQNYVLTSDDNTTVTPPNTISVSVGAVVSGDYVLVGKDDGAGGFATTALTATGTAAATTLTLSGTPASDVPTGSGFIRVTHGGVSNAHSYTGISGTTVSGLSPAIPAGGYSGDAVWFPYIDKASTGTSVPSGTFNYASDFTARVRVRNGGASPIVPFETTFSVTSVGGSVNAIRAADA